jgi:hypothetical protein
VHAVRVLLGEQRVGPAGERELGRAVGAGSGARDAAGGRGDVDDRAGRGCAQQRQQRLGEPHLGVEVDKHRAVHVGVAAVGEARAPGGAGVVDEQVQAPVALEHVLADARGCVLVEQVRRDVADTPLAELGGERAQALLAAGDEHERAPGLAREAARGCFADAA